MVIGPARASAASTSSRSAEVIADFLFEHAIPYKYEPRNHWWGKRNYRPDFTIFKTNQSGVIIEYFGLEGDPEYDARSQKEATLLEA